MIQLMLGKWEHTRRHGRSNSFGFMQGILTEYYEVINAFLSTWWLFNMQCFRFGITIGGKGY